MKSLLKYISLLICAITLFWGCEEGPNFTEYDYPPQTASGISPEIGYPGQDITITGTNFDTLTGAVKVWFGGILATDVVSSNGTQIVVTVPDDAVSGKVGLQVWTTKIDSIGTFTVLSPPIIASIIFDNGGEVAQPGDTITISGSGFKDGTEVLFGETEAEVISILDTEIKVKVPDAESGVITLTYDNQVVVEGPYFLIGLQQISGSIIGHESSWGDNPDTYIDAAFDGDITTAVDAPSSTGYVGYDVGMGKAALILSVRYVPRSSHPQRMVGGEIRGANDPTLFDAVTLHTITEEPTTGIYTEVSISTNESYRYIYYYSADGYCNIAEIEFYGNIVDAASPEGKHIFEFDDPESAEWIPQQDASYIIEDNLMKVTFNSLQFEGTNKRRADLKYMNTPWIYTSEYPILAIKFTMPEVVNFRPDITGFDSGFSNNDYEDDFEGQDVYYWDLSAKTTNDRVECNVFQFKIPDITSDETGYEVDWVRTFKSVEELQSFIGQ